MIKFPHIAGLYWEIAISLSGVKTAFYSADLLYESTNHSSNLSLCGGCISMVSVKLFNWNEAFRLLQWKRNTAKTLLECTQKLNTMFK